MKMWLDNLKELKAETKMSTKTIAERANLPEKTVTRVLSGRTTNPYIDTLDRIATALGATIGDILAGTKAVVADASLSELQAQMDATVAQNATLAAANEVLIAENAILQKQVDTMSAKIDLLQMQLMHKEELLAVHNYYIKKQGQ